MQINPLIFRNYDIRGTIPEDLDYDKIMNISKAYGTFLRKRKIRQAVVGYDCRLSGEEFSRVTALFAGSIQQVFIIPVVILIVISPLVILFSYIKTPKLGQSDTVLFF